MLLRRVGPAEQGEVLGKLGEPWGGLRKIREHWGLLGYLPPLHYPPPLKTFYRSQGITRRARAVVAMGIRAQLRGANRPTLGVALVLR